MLNNTCVYTCITGDYDDVINFPKFKEECFDYYLFTNNKNVTSTFWNVIYIEDNCLDNIRLARKIKILGHPILEKYDYSIWIDGASYPRKKISLFLNECCDLNKYSLIGFKHPERDCIYDEGKACVIFGREEKEIVIKQMNYLKRDNYPLHNGLIESCILVRNNKDKNLIKTMNQWFDMILKFSCRDQLSFNYVAYKNHLNFFLLDMKGFDNDYFGRINHSIIKSNDYKFKKCRLYFGDDSDLKKYNYDYDLRINYQFISDKKMLVECKSPKYGNEIKIELTSYAGIKIKNIRVVDKKNKITYFNHIFVNNCVYFLNSRPTILIKTKYKKNENIRIIFDMQSITECEYQTLIDSLYLTINDLNFKLDNCNSIINRLNNENEQVKKLLNMLSNSISWKITKPIRLFNKLFRKVVSLHNEKK